jgi:hypothetical protein
MNAASVTAGFLPVRQHQDQEPKTADCRVYVSDLEEVWAPSSFTHAAITKPVVSALKNYYM